MIKQILLAVMLMFCTLALPPAVKAADLFNKVCGEAGTGDSAACQGNNGNNPVAGTDGAIVHIANIIAIIAGGAAVIILLVSAIRYITSGGDAGKAKSARDGIVGALIGLAIIVLARSIIAFVLGKL
jgi:hypothetical protein